MTPAVFLDRDGTMVHDVGYLSHLPDLRWFPWTVDAIRALNRAGLLVFVTTNQGGIGLGHTTESFVLEAHAEMHRFLESQGARIDGWFFCPHHPRAVAPELRVECDCRKPKPGMIRQAVARFDIDLPRSFVVGDKLSDVGLAHAVGAGPILVRTGYGEGVLRGLGDEPPAGVHVAADLSAAVSWILMQTGPWLAAG